MTAPTTNGGVRRPAGAVIVGGIIALALMATAAVLFIQGNAATERLGLLFAILSPTILTLVAALRSDTAAARLNGSFDERIKANMQQALIEHRSTGAAAPVPPKVPALPIELEK